MTAHTEQVKQTVKRGDTITHTRFFGCIEEHIFIEWEGVRMIAEPTQDTVRLKGLQVPASDHTVSDIYPDNVTHINRTPVCRAALTEDL